MRSRSQIQQWWCFLVNMRRLEKLFLLCRGKTSRGQYCHWKWHFPSKAWKMVTQQQIIKCKEMIKIAFYSWETLCSTAHCHSPPIIHIIAVILKLVWKMFKLERKWCVCLWLFAYSQSAVFYLTYGKWFGFQSFLFYCSKKKPSPGLSSDYGSKLMFSCLPHRQRESLIHLKWAL